MQYSLDVNVHADPFGARAPVAINPAINVRSLNTDVVGKGAPVAPPFSWTKQSDHRRASRDSEMSRASIASHVNLRISG
jgi:hypothetical protein